MTKPYLIVNLIKQQRESDWKNDVLEACLYAVYVCTYKLSTSIWEGSFIPAFCTAQILEMLQNSENDEKWDAFPQLLLWLLFVGGAFSERKLVRLQFAALILGSYRNRIAGLHGSWEETREILEQFVWSKRTLSVYFQTFWEEIHPAS